MGFCYESGTPFSLKEEHHMLRRHELTDDQWGRIEHRLPGRKGTRGVTAKDNRLFVNAVVYVAKTGIPWRDLPERFGPWKTVYNRFSLWSRRRHWEAIFKHLQVEFDEEGVLLDASIVRAHQDASGGKGGSSATLWVVHVVDSRPRSTRSSIRKGVRSTSKSRPVNSTSPRLPSNSSSTLKARR